MFAASMVVIPLLEMGWGIIFFAACIFPEAFLLVGQAVQEGRKK